MLAFIAARLFEDTPGQVILVASDVERAEKMRDDCAMLLGEGNVRYFGARPLHSAEMLEMSGAISQIETLKALTQSSKLLVVASAHSIAERVPAPGSFRERIIELKTGQDYEFQRLAELLSNSGFEKKDFVETYGDFAVRGGIVDVFSHVGENPLRFEFWGNAVESIREFDVLSQRSIRELDAASIVPELASPGLASVETAGVVSLPASVFDYLGRDALVVMDEPEIVRREIEELFREGGSGLFSYQDISGFAAKFPCLINSMLGPQEKNSGFELDFESLSQPSFNGSISMLVGALKDYNARGLSIYLTCDTANEAKRLNELIEDVLTQPETDEGTEHIRRQPEAGSRNLAGEKGGFQNLKYKIVAETLHSGFIYPAGGIALLTEHEIFGRLKRRGSAKRRRFKGFSKKELQQLKRGNCVVHVDHGIGTFAGLTKIKVGGVEQEVMKLLFLENDALYVNLNFVNRVQKYSSQEGHTPKLSKLGTADWERTKARAKRHVKDIARDIIALYAKRKHEKGFAFSADTHWQKELEASFMYEDTADQVTATMDIKADMESASPMDRLVCGDVGFGKTEVAVRAAFKAVMDGKQAAVLVPTTILALQHYNTFHDRLSRYATRIENITRFKSPRDQKRIVESLANGSIDVIIGTHRLLSKDILFKDLGLLVIDEEHRFGVAAKEKLRKLKATVDTLTLTATPIPRTLHFSLIGARDLSLITTPPRNRLPIVTEIIAADSNPRRAQWQVIREAVLKELYRNGQIYFVHDRVTTIDAVAEQVKTHVPEARVKVAHGQMTGHELEKSMLDFLEKKFDVLICTKIIESGLDIPNVNTIIINRADRFGLAELYQLRGRVGRSNIQAYAYFLVPPLSVMPKAALRRLQAIEEFTELGSGFNLAMRDLEIRGAGNLLGAEQSGFIMDMGFEMYERIVREAVEELKKEEFSDIFKPSGRALEKEQAIVESDIDAYIPDFYLESDSERLDVYRRLYRAATREDLGVFREELRDRFGEYPEEVENLFLLVELRLAASEAGFSKIEIKGRNLAITLPEESDDSFYGKGSSENSPFQAIIKKISGKKEKRFNLKQEGKSLKLFVEVPPAPDNKTLIKYAREALESLAA